MTNNQSIEFDELTKFIGTYVLYFQVIENKLEQSLQLMTGLQYWSLTHAISENLSFREKLDIIRSHLTVTINNTNEEIKKTWLEKSARLTFNKIEKIMSKRNSLVHSSYIYEFLEHDGPIISARKKIKKDGVKFEYFSWTSEERNTALKEISEVVLEMSLFHKQLIAWSEMFKQDQNN